MIFPEPPDDQVRALSVDGDHAAQQRLSAMMEGQEPDIQAQIQKMIDLIGVAENDEDTQTTLSGILLDTVKKLPVEADNECRAAFANATPEALQQALTIGDEGKVAAAGSAPGGARGIPGLDDDDDEPIVRDGQAQSFLGTAVGFVPKFLNLTTFLLMFYRCGTVGANGMQQAVRRLKAISRPVKIHLVGHSLGGRAVTACGKGLVSDPVAPVESMMLLEAAYSHFGLSQGTGASGIPHPRGFFRDVIDKNVVKGPILATYSDQDSVVGFAYTSMAAVSLNNARTFGDEKSPFGGMGRNGVLDTPEAFRQDLKLPGEAYNFDGHKIHSLNGSRKVNGKALISAHGDVKNAAVTWAFASLVATT